MIFIPLKNVILPIIKNLRRSASKEKEDPGTPALRTSQLASLAVHPVVFKKSYDWFCRTVVKKILIKTIRIKKYLLLSPTTREIMQQSRFFFFYFYYFCKHSGAR